MSLSCLHPPSLDLTAYPPLHFLSIRPIGPQRSRRNARRMRSMPEPRPPPRAPLGRTSDPTSRASQVSNPSSTLMLESCPPSEAPPAVAFKRNAPSASSSARTACQMASHAQTCVTGPVASVPSLATVLRVPFAGMEVAMGSRPVTMPTLRWRSMGAMDDHLAHMPVLTGGISTNL